MNIDPNAPADKPETQQMKVIHRAMRREFGQAPALVAAVDPGDTARAQLLGKHLRLVLGMLHEHHEAEDELLWPALRARASMSGELVSTMEKQHEAVAAAGGRVDAALSRWTGTATAEDRDDLAAGLRALLDALTEHLELEEEAVLPLIHDHLSVAEWLAPQKHAMAHGPKSPADRLLMAGLVLEDATDRERAWFMNEMPPPARVMWRLIGTRQYASRVRAVRAA